MREAALILLYRLLFILYAEDRDLLPVRNTSYDDYALREKVRGDVGHRKDRGDVFSTSAARYWSAIDDLCRAIDQGDASIGLPPYNGGLFDRKRIPLLANIQLGDDVMAKAIDALSFEQTPNGRRYINYRDLGVQQLGSIYERLLEQEIVRDGSEIAVRPNVFARKGSGSYYTPDDLVGLIIKETIGPLVRLSMDNFTAKHSELAGGQLPEDRRISRLKQLDPAEKLLELKVCDPAMGSGHFLVNLVDYLADRVITAMAEAEALVDDYISPLTERIDVIRNTIIDNAEKTRLDHRYGTTRRSAYRPAHGSQALRLWRRQEPHGRRTGQGLALAAHLHGGRAVELPGSSPPLRGQPVRFMGPQRDRQGKAARRPALFARAAKTGHAGCGSHADH